MEPQEPVQAQAVENQRHFDPQLVDQLIHWMNMSPEQYTQIREQKIKQMQRDRPELFTKEYQEEQKRLYQERFFKDREVYQQQMHENRQQFQQIQPFDQNLQLPNEVPQQQPLPEEAQQP